MPEIKIQLKQIIDSIPIIQLSKDTLNIDDIKKHKIDLNQVIEINNINYDSTIELAKNEILKEIKIVNFKEIINWNYKERGIYFQNFTIIQENPNFSITGFIECSKKTNKKVIFYITIADYKKIYKWLKM